MRYAILALILVALFFMTACKTVLESQRTDTVEKLETRSGVSVRDTLLTVPGAHVSGSILLPPFGAELPTHTVRSERAWSSVAITAGTLQFSGGCDTVLLAAKLYDRWSQEHKQRDTETTVERTVIKTVVPKWAWWSLGISIALLVKLFWPLISKLFKPF